MMIKIIISNPNHHFNNALRILSACTGRGLPCELISFCAFRGFHTPELPAEFNHVKRHVFLNTLSKLKKRESLKTTVSGENKSKKADLVKNLIWKSFIRTFLHIHTRPGDKIILFNDNAYPFDKIVDDLVLRKVDVSLIQEGIRFDVPISADNTIRLYGSSEVDRVFCWGKHSQQYFNRICSEKTETVVSGAPYFYSVSKNLTNKPAEKNLGVFTNPIEQFGYCTEQEKLATFKQFADKLAPVLKSLELKLLFRSHPNEDLDAYKKILSEAGIKFELNGGPIFEAIERVGWGIIWASTVGVELLLKNKPIAQLPLADGKFVFDYVSSGSAVPVNLENLRDSIESLVKQDTLSKAAGEFLDNHIQLKTKPESIILDELSD